MKQVLAVTIVSLLTLAGLSIVDSTLVKTFFKPKEIQVSEIHYLPPSTTAIYETPEFTYTVTTNKEGYRSDEINSEKPANSIRIMAIGDSFTYGWGVPFDSIWTALVKNDLQKKYPDKQIEMYNFGVPGGSPDNYLDNAKKFIPTLKPDLVIVGLTGADDIGQLMSLKGGGNGEVSDETRKKRDMYLTRMASAPSTKTLNIIGRTLNALYPNTYAYVAKNKRVNVKSLWAQQTHDYIKQLDDITITRFEKISPEVQNLFFTSSLSPALLWLNLYDEQHYVKVLGHPELTSAYERLRSTISGIEALTKDVQANLILVDIPTSPYIDSYYVKKHQTLGLATSDQTPVTTTINDDVKSALEGLDLMWVSNLERMREQCKEDCYFPFDGHMNTKGHKILAESIAKAADSFIQK